MLTTDGEGADRRAPWQDTDRPAAERVDDLLARMTLEEKVGQLYGVWVGVDPDGDGEVAPHQHDLADAPADWPGLIRHGLGQLTRPFGTAPVDPALGARALARAQAEIVAAGRFGIPAMAHEECLAGFTTWGATAYPVPLAWGATFDPALVERMAARIGADLRAVGVHQGLSPVLDVSRDPRWGRTEETIAEDPYLVGTVGTAYVRGLESAGVVATLKHFIGYSASRAGRNLAPAPLGPREIADILLPPFEMALRDGGARSVMQSYVDIDGVPVAADPDLLTTLLRDVYGFTGTVVSDYFGVSFLETLHRTAADQPEAAAQALIAGVDVELPTVRCYRDPLLSAIRNGRVPETFVDRAARRVLLQKCELGLLDPGWTPLPHHPEPGTLDLDPPESRALARQLAEESMVLAANNGILPLLGRPDSQPEGTPGQPVRPGRIAVVGPRADDAMAMLGCYSFPSHVGVRHPELPMGIDIPTVLDAIRSEFAGSVVEFAEGCGVDDADTSGLPTAVELAAGADVCVAVLGDRSGLFGRGTSGEGCDAADLRLPGVQQELLEALLDSGTPVVLVMLAGRPYALGAVTDRPGGSGLAATVLAFFPGEEGGPAVAGVLSGRVNPSGRLPVGVPRDPGGQPVSYLVPPLGAASEVSNLDPTPLYAFGHGLSYSRFEWTDARVDGPPETPTDGVVTLSVTVRNASDRAGAEVVQLYLHDPVAQVVRPVTRLVGYARLPLDAGERRRLTFAVPADVTAFVGRRGHRVVEPGDLELRLATSSASTVAALPVRLTGPERVVDHTRRLTVAVTFR
jgi:beta-xylosidase